MPLIDKDPKRMGSQVVTEFVDSVGSSGVTYTLKDTTIQQETLAIYNISPVDLLVSVGTQSNVSVPAYRGITLTESYTSFTIRSVSGVGGFRASCSYEDADEQDEHDFFSKITTQMAEKVSSTNIKNIRDNTDVFEYSIDGTTWKQVQGGGGVIEVKSSGSDDTVNINNAINTVSQQGGGKVLLTDASYLALGIQLKSNVTLELNEKTRIIKNGGSVTSHIIESTGTTFGSAISLTVDASITSSTVTVGSTTGIQAGDYVLLRDNFFVALGTGRNQEINRVASVTSTTITLVNPLIRSYLVANVGEIIKINPIVNATLKGGTLEIPVGTSGGNFYGILNVGTYIDKCTALRPCDHAGFWFEQSALCRGNMLQVKDGQNNAVAGSGYGLFIGASSHHCWFDNCYTEGIRENPISWNVRHSGFFKCMDRGGLQDSFNSHGTGNDHVYILYCSSVGSRGQGISVGSTSTRLGDTNVYIEGCEIINPWFNGVFIASVTTGLLNHKNVNIKNCKFSGVGLNGTTNCYHVTATYTDGLVLEGSDFDGLNDPKALQSVFLTAVNKVKIRRSDFRNLPSYGIVFASGSTFTDVLIESCTFDGIASFNIRNLGTITNFRVINNSFDDGVNAFTADVQRGNTYGTKRDRDYGNTASVSDGGTIAHNCVSTPKFVSANGNVPLENVKVTAITATNFTVSIKKADGTAGTAQTIYWEAEV
jgi:hypothetical protein